MRANYTARIPFLEILGGRFTVANCEPIGENIKLGTNRQITVLFLTQKQTNNTFVCQSVPCSALLRMTLVGSPCAATNWTILEVAGKTACWEWRNAEVHLALTNSRYLWIKTWHVMTLGWKTPTAKILMWVIEKTWIVLHTRTRTTNICTALPKSVPSALD